MIFPEYETFSTGAVACSLGVRICLHVRQCGVLNPIATNSFYRDRNDDLVVRDQCRSRSLPILPTLYSVLRICQSACAVIGMGRDSSKLFRLDLGRHRSSTWIEVTAKCFEA
jgi:hypothetical protein